MARIKQQYSPRTPVKDLWGEFTLSKSIHLPDRWDEHTGDYRYDVWEAVQCDECGKWVVMHGDGESRHSDYDRNWDSDDFEESACDGYLYSEGAIMSYAYPIDLKRIYNNADRAALLIAHLPLCLIEMDGDYYLALTGGGMDLSWEIAEAYMRLGYLPPTQFSDLPLYAGQDLNGTRRWILRGMRRSLNLQINWAKSDLARLNHVTRQLAERSR
jgi:hypothetical protein